MPDTRLKFKCPGIACQHWFTLYQAVTEKKNNGTALLIHCPMCGGYVEKIRRVLTGRGTNLEPRDVVHPIASRVKPVPPPPHASVFVQLDYLTRTLMATKCPPSPKVAARKNPPPCGMGRGDTSPLMLRVPPRSRDIAGVLAAATRRPGKKRPKR